MPSVMVIVVVIIVIISVSVIAAVVVFTAMILECSRSVKPICRPIIHYHFYPHHLCSCSSETPTLRLPRNMIAAAAANKKEARPIIMLRKPKGWSRTKIIGPTVERPLPSPSAAPEAIDRIRVGKF